MRDIDCDTLNQLVSIATTGDGEPNVEWRGERTAHYRPDSEIVIGVSPHAEVHTRVGPAEWSVDFAPRVRAWVGDYRHEHEAGWSTAADLRTTIDDLAEQVRLRQAATLPASILAVDIAVRDTETARSALARAERDRDEKIREAIADGQRVAVLAERARLAVSRIYQIRDAPTA